MPHYGLARARSPPSRPRVTTHEAYTAVRQPDPSRRPGSAARKAPAQPTYERSEQTQQVSCVRGSDEGATSTPSRRAHAYARGGHRARLKHEAHTPIAAAFVSLTKKSIPRAAALAGQPVGGDRAA